MGKLYVNNGSWRTVKVVAVNQNGTWRFIKNAWVNQNGTWRRFYGTDPGSETYLTPSTFNWTVPDGIYAITLTGCGGGGQGGRGDGGANNDGPGSGGGGSNLITSSYNVTPGTQLAVTVGAGGAGSTGNGFNGQATAVSGPGVNFFAAGGGGGGGVAGWGGTGLRAGLGANGAQHFTTAHTQAAGLSTNGGSNGGRGGNYSRALGGEPGIAGTSGKLTIQF